MREIATILGELDKPIELKVPKNLVGPYPTKIFDY